MVLDGRAQGRVEHGRPDPRLRCLAGESGSLDRGQGFMSPTDRMSRPEEQATAIVFLAPDAASDINGVVLPVDDGWSAV